MTATNIDHFNEITGQVFAHLYQSFPLPVLLRPEMLGITEHEGGEYSPEVGEALGIEPQSEEEVLFKHSVSWLIQTGYLTANKLQPDGCLFGQARLTAKGLEVLNATPVSLAGKEPLGAQLAAASKSGGKELLRTITSEVLGIGVRMAMKSAGIDP